MSNVAQRLMSIGKTQKGSESATAIFGSALNLADSIGQISTFRVAIYPFINEQSPEVAMGIAACLSYYLEQYPSIEIYRIFARVDEDDSDEEIDISDSQFMIDDWELDGLDDNVAIWGSFSENGNELQLELTVDRSLLTVRMEKISLVTRFLICPSW